MCSSRHQNGELETAIKEVKPGILGVKSRKNAFFEKKSGKILADSKKRRTFASQLRNEPAQSMKRRVNQERMGKYQSGQMGQTVNLLAYAFGGSNPSLPTKIAEVAQLIEH